MLDLKCERISPNSNSFYEPRICLNAINSVSYGNNLVLRINSVTVRKLYSILSIEHNNLKYLCSSKNIQFLYGHCRYSFNVSYETQNYDGFIRVQGIHL